MTMPGFITGQPLSGQGVGQALFQFLPSLPHESPIPMPRALARALFPQGFQPFRAAPTMVVPQAAPLMPPAGIPAAPVVQPPPQAARPPAQPVAQPPQPLVTRSISSGGNPIRASSQRVRIRERPGL